MQYVSNTIQLISYQRKTSCVVGKNLVSNFGDQRLNPTIEIYMVNAYILTICNPYVLCIFENKILKISHIII